MIVGPFFAFAWPRGQPLSPRLQRVIAIAEAAPDLCKLVDLPGFIFLGSASSSHVLIEGGGIVWGPLFDRRSSTFSIKAGDGELHAPAERFLRNFWGGYLALRSFGDGVEILRDPSGMVPCYIATVDGVELATSAPKLFFELGLLEAERDWTVVAQALTFRDLRPAQTALRGISELLPGMAAKVGRGATRAQATWTPWRFAAEQVEIDDFADAVGAVREAVLQVGRAWSRTAAVPIVELSGGLDSSIVTASLALAGSAPLCATFVPIAGDSDERDFARAVAKQFELELIELVLDPAIVDISRSDSSELPRPCARSFTQALDRPLQQLARSVGGDMFLGGGGGDNIFCHLQSTLPVVDLLRRRGLSAAALRSTMDVAEVADVTFWQALRSVAKRTLDREQKLPTPRRNRFMADSAVHDLPWPQGNPWLEPSVQVLPGKRRQIWGLISISNHLEGYGRQHVAPMCSPLLSQPVVETCLRIPTWLWFNHGQNRSVAREAFRGLLPNSILGRRSKGAFDTLAANVIRRNASRLRSMLLDGVLVRQGVADPAKISAAFERPLPDGRAIVDLLVLADVEAWVCAWGE
ncbi:asparagine synthase-related protein [Sphingomonas canadensis]|uniref:asparagine synthase (glutamine-hydrolyzing) n=1 Tax=Sphingomonas canadensis TaxID=1219257 RepID=A0ABW3HDH2_9SPHN|nr:asparagine synthase-related protein [Sphingomonas canadensis]MCW3838183.1 asparagine synthase-related protein [Sphingomonas canadensis]